MYYVFRLSWSQTDTSTCIVKGQDEQDARSKIKGNAKYVDLIAKSARLID